MVKNGIVKHPKYAVLAIIQNQMRNSELLAHLFPKCSVASLQREARWPHGLCLTRMETLPYFTSFSKKLGHKNLSVKMLTW